MTYLVSIECRTGRFRRYECTPGVKPRLVGTVYVPNWALIDKRVNELDRNSVENYRTNG